MAPASSAPVSALPLPIRVTNWLGHGLSRWGVKICSSKRFHYGGRPTHDEVGAGIDDDLVEALGVLVESFNGDVALSPFGRFAVGAFLQGIVEKQIALATRFRAEPALAERAIRRPIFVAGLPRTGTTLLHNLLSQAPQTLALRTWETHRLAAAITHPHSMP